MSATATQPRLLTPAEIATIVRAMRTQMAWSQETLAELARLTVRTVQRLEAGQPASLDTRRAVASALGWDLNFFDVPRTFPTEEDMAAQKTAFDREHLILDAAQADGRGILTRLHDIVGYKAISTCSLAQLSREGQDAFAAVSDFVADCLDIIGDVPRVDVLQYGDQLTGLAGALADTGYQLHIASRETSIYSEAWGDAKQMPITVVYIVAASIEQVVQHIAVKRRIAM